MTSGGAAARFGLEDKVAIVTGGSRGLGREMCLAFAEQGARVVVASRKGDACEALAAEITERYGTEALAVPFHAGSWSDCDALVNATLDRFGRIDVLVNNAGMSPLYPSIAEVTEALYDKVLDVNLKGPFRLMALAGTYMAEQGSGSIINVSSIASMSPSAAEVPYGAAKAGLNALTLGMANTFGPNVRVNCIVPGAFLTDISNAWTPEMKGYAAGRTALKRNGEPDEVVGAALYFASDASSYTTGALLRIDGGVF